MKNTLLHNNSTYKLYMGSGHTDIIKSIAFSPDIKYVITGSNDGTIKQWDIATGKEIQTFRRHNNWVNSVDINSNGMYIISGGDDDMIRLWNLKNGKHISIFKGWKDEIQSIKFSIGDKYIIYGSSNGTIKLWDIKKEILIHTFEGYTDRITSIDISSNGKYVVSGSDDRSMKLWNLKTKNLTHSFDAETSSCINSVSISPNGKYVLSGRGDGTIKLWDTEEGNEIHTFIGHEYSVNSLCFTPNGQYIVSAGVDSTIKLWDLENKKLIYTFEGHTDSINSIAVSSDGKYIISGSDDETIKLWDIKNRQVIRTFESTYYTHIDTVAVTQEGKHFISKDKDNSVKLRDTNNGKILQTYEKNNENINFISISLDEQYIVTGNFEEGAKSWNFKNGKKISNMSSIATPVVAISSDVKSIISNFDGNLQYVWDIYKEKTILEFNDSRWDIPTAISPDNRYVVYSIEYTSIMRLMEISSKKDLYIFEGHTEYVNSIFFSSDGKYIVSGSDDKTIKLWDTTEGINIRTYKGHQFKINSVSISDNGKYIISGDINGIIKLWNTETSNVIHTFMGHNDAITSVHISSNAKYIVSGSKDNTTKLWDVSSGTELLQYLVFTDGEWIISTREGYYNCSNNAMKYISFLDKKEGEIIVMNQSHPVYKERKRMNLLDMKTKSLDKDTVYQIIKQLQLLKAAIKVESETIIKFILKSFESIEYDDDIKNILKNTSNKEYGSIVKDIDMYLQRFSEDKDSELQGLQLELKTLIPKLQELSNKKSDYLNRVYEFNIAYHSKLGSLIQNLLAIKEKILYASLQKKQETFKSLKSEYNVIKDIHKKLKLDIVHKEEKLNLLDEFDDTYDTCYDELQVLKTTLREKEVALNTKRKETKIAKKALNKNDETREYEEIKQAAETFRKENNKDQYNLGDEEKDALEIGKNYNLSSDIIDDKKLLSYKIEENRSMINELETDIETIEKHEVMQIFQTYEYMEDYISEIKDELENEYTILQSHYKNEDTNTGNIDTTNKVEQETGKYADTLYEISQPSFNRLRQLNSSNAIKNRGDYHQLELETNILTKEEELYQYIHSFGRMHKATLYSAFDVLFENYLEDKIVNVIDWGSGQALGSAILIDFIRDKDIKIEISDIMLLEPSEIALSRGLLHLDILKDTEYHIKTINKDIDSLTVKELKIDNNNINMHLFSNILDIDYFNIEMPMGKPAELFNIETLYDKIVNAFHGTNYFVCISPNTEHSRNDRLESFYTYFSEHHSVELISQRKNNIGDYSRYEIIFKVNI